jgi:predicted alpha/beta superfamily hydrolase
VRAIQQCLALLLVIVGIAFSPSAMAQDQGRFVEMPEVKSAFLEPSHVTVWLPPGYDTSKRRYGVVYMHDSQNLFFLERSNFNKVWAADKSALRLIAAGKVSPFIIVGVSQPGDARYGQYLPQALYEAASPPLRATFDAIARRPIYSDNYLRFLVTELKPMIDRQFQTLRDRDHTAIAGSSMGGLISCYAFTRYPKIFGRAGCISTHWPMGDPTKTGEHSAEIVKLWSNEFAYGLGPRGKRRLWMDHGDKTLDAYYPPYQAEITKAVKALGWREGKNFTARAYPGAEHEENAWAARMDDIFGWMLKGW